MINYSPFWNTLKNSSESTYTLINSHKISSNTIDRMRKEMPISTQTLNDLCRILNCSVQDIVQYVPSDKDSKL